MYSLNSLHKTILIIELWRCTFFSKFEHFKKLIAFGLRYAEIFRVNRQSAALKEATAKILNFDCIPNLGQRLEYSVLFNEITVNIWALFFIPCGTRPLGASAVNSGVSWPTNDIVVQLPMKSRQISTTSGPHGDVTTTLLFDAVRRWSPDDVAWYCCRTWEYQWWKYLG